MAACEEKIRFPTAKSVKQKIRRLRNVIKKPLKHYHCPECGGYHITSKTSMAYKIKARE